MNKFIDMITQPVVYKFLQNLWFVLACVFCALLVFCLLASKIVSVGYAIGGLGVSALMYFLNGRLLNRATLIEEVLKEMHDSSTSTTDSSI